MESKGTHIYNSWFIDVGPHKTHWRIHLTSGVCRLSYDDLYVRQDCLTHCLQWDVCLKYCLQWDVLPEGCYQGNPFQVLCVTCRCVSSPRDFTAPVAGSSQSVISARVLLLGGLVVNPRGTPRWYRTAQAPRCCCEGRHPCPLLAGLIMCYDPQESSSP